MERRIGTGDFNGDGKTDIALTGGGGRGMSVAVAFSNGDGTFSAIATDTSDFAGWSQVSGATPVTGDFNADGKTDIALTGGIGWNTIPVALSRGDGTFNVVNVNNNESTTSFATW